MGTDADLRSSGASLHAMDKVTLRRILAESASLKTRPPVALLAISHRFP